MSRCVDSWTSGVCVCCVYEEKVLIESAKCTNVLGWRAEVIPDERIAVSEGV